MINAKFAVIVLILLCLPMAAQATPIGYSFDYTFSSGAVLSGMLSGELQSDNDTVLVDTVSMVSYSGLPVLEFPETLIRTTASISGAFMDLATAAPNGVLGGWILFNPTQGDFAAVVARPDFSRLEYEAFDASRWNLVAKVPEPATLAIMGLGLAGIGFRRRERNTAA